MLRIIVEDDTEGNGFQCDIMCKGSINRVAAQLSSAIYQMCKQSPELMHIVNDMLDKKMKKEGDNPSAPSI